jgi:hypothetical protein
MNKKILNRITFNIHKHHFRFLTGQLQNWPSLAWPQVDKELKVIGENLLDLYTGSLSPEEISLESSGQLESLNIRNRAAFEKWLLPEKYKKIVLSDGSQWVLKKGNNKPRYIHLHPGKFSPFTIRVRGTTLKTALAVIYIAVQTKRDLKQIDLQFVNFVRTAYLGLSPVKLLHRNKGISRMLDLFVKSYRSHSHLAEAHPKH